MTYQPSVRSRTRLVSHCLAAAMTAVIAIPAGGALAAADYPTKPVRVFVPYGPGGVGDLTMRLLADKLGDQLKQQFVIENRPGAGGIVSATQVLRAQPGNSPYKTLQDVVDAAKKNPGKLNLGAINPGSTQNLSAYLFEQVTGADFAIVTYRTTPELVTALLRGDVDLGFDYYAGFVGEIGDGKLRIIATSGEERDPLLKDIPTAKEGGFPQYVVTSWNGVAGPAGLSDEIVQILNREINRALAAPDLQQKARGLGIEARASTPQEMHDRMAADVARWRGVIDKAGIPKQ